MHAQGTGRVALIIASEREKVLEGEIDELGLRHLQLTWSSFPNHLANADGLTDFGRQGLSRMSEPGIIADLTGLFDLIMTIRIAGLALTSLYKGATIP